MKTTLGGKADNSSPIGIRVVKICKSPFFLYGLSLKHKRDPLADKYLSIIEKN